MLEKRFYLKFSDPPFNISELSRRIKRSTIWHTNSKTEQKTSPNSGPTIDPSIYKESWTPSSAQSANSKQTSFSGDYEKLLLDAIRSCKLLHRNQVFDHMQQHNMIKAGNMNKNSSHFGNSLIEDFGKHGYPEKGENPILPIYSNLHSASLTDYGYGELSKYLDKPLINASENKKQENNDAVVIDTAASKSSLVAGLRKALNKSNHKNTHEHSKSWKSQRTHQEEVNSNTKDSKKNDTTHTHHFSQSEPLDLLRKVMNRNSNRLTISVLYSYLTTPPYPPTHHAISLLKHFKSNPWIQPTTFMLLNPTLQSSIDKENDSSLNTISDELKDYQSYRQNAFVKMITKLGRYDNYKYADPLSDEDVMSSRQLKLTERVNKLIYKDSLTLTDICWIVLRNAVYRQEFDKAFEVVDIATKPLEVNIEKKCENSQKDKQVPKTEFPNLPLSKRQKLSLALAQISRSPSLQLQLSSTFLFASFSFAYLSIFYWSKFSASSMSMDEAEPLAAAIALAFDMDLSSYSSLPGSLALTTIVSLVPPMIYFISLGGSLVPFSSKGLKNVRSTATQRVRWSSSTLWQRVFPSIIKDASFISLISQFVRFIKSALASLFNRLLNINTKPNTRLKPSMPTQYTNMSYEGLTETDRVVLELKMTDYIAVAFDEISDVTVDNYHLFGQSANNSIIDDLVEETKKSKEDFETTSFNENLENEQSENAYPASAIDITTKEILPLQLMSSSSSNSSTSFNTKKQNDSEGVFVSRKGPSIAQSRAQVVLTEQLAKRKMRIKETGQERWFNEYWTMSGDEYVWVEPDQDPSTNVLRKLRYGQK